MNVEEPDHGDEGTKAAGELPIQAKIPDRARQGSRASQGRVKKFALESPTINTHE